MDKIAIIGLSCLFPGADSPARFWQNLIEARETTSQATAEQMGMDPALVYNPDHITADTTYFLRGGYIRDFRFDPNGYALHADYLRTLGEPFQWTLYAAKSALADSGYLSSPDVLARCGLIMGNLSFPTRMSNQLFGFAYKDMIETALRDLLERDIALPDSVVMPDASVDNALSPGYPATITTQALGLGGLHFALDAACASSLYAVGLACMSLAAGKADLMLAGAVSAADPLFVNMGFAQMGAYPGDGKDSRPLDGSSDGLISGEGAGMFVLKRYDDALRDGDRIYAVVSGVGLSNDGRGKHVLTPNSKGQVLAFERAYQHAGVQPDTVQYVECHASGTPLGDKTELNSMEIFFSKNGHIPLIGSVKSNVGHLLTVAGMASMMKVVLSMAHEQIPATVGIKYPLASQGNQFAGPQIVTQPVAWPSTERPDAGRHAGVNAFGFGGVSAHAVLETPPHDESSTVKIRTQSVMDSVTGKSNRLAIVGMDAHFGPLDGLDSFAHAIYDGDTAFIPLPENRWKGVQHQPELLRRFGLPDGAAPDGAYIESFDLDFKYYKIPPNPADEPIPQQLLMLKVADKAIRDAGLREGTNVAVLVALNTELSLHQFRGRADLTWQVKQALTDAGIQLTPEQMAELERIAKDALLTPAQVNHYASYIGNIAASRVSALWDFSGPAFTISAEENSVFKALEVAQLLLANGEVDAVVVGAVDLAGSVENVLVRNSRAALHAGKPTAGFSRDSTGWLIGEGAGAVVLVRADAPHPKSLSHVNEERDLQGGVYAYIDALTFAQVKYSDSPSAQNVAQAARDALEQAGVTSADVGYVELHASGIPHEDVAEIEGITAVYRGVSDEATCAIGSVKANVGHTYAASGMASLIKAALCVSQRFLPAIPNWAGPELPESWQETPFFAAAQSRTWFDSRRVAAVSSLGADGTAGHLILSSASDAARDNGYLQHGSPYLLLLAGDDAATLNRKLDEMAAQIDGTRHALSLQDVASRFYADYAATLNARYTLAIVGRNAKEITQEIDRARQGITEALRSGGVWSTPAGSYFTASPVGRSGDVAFVYPGAFNSYPKLGYDLFHLFPHTIETLRQIKSDVGEAVAERLLYPRTLEKPGPKVTNAMKNALAENAVAMVESGLSFASAYTRSMMDVFRVQPARAFGYSLGEGSMMWGLGVWTDGDAGSAALHRSTLFTTRLTGPMNAVRDAWGIGADVPAEQFWAAYFVAAPAESVRQAVSREVKVYLTHINTPNEVMIAGDPAACLRVLGAVGGESMRAPFDVVIHNEAMMGEFGEFYPLHDWPVTPLLGVTLYSAADYAPLRTDRKVIASAISRMACKQVDFPRLIERAYADGARVFIELGPRSTCARWISETLGAREHVAVSIDNIGVDAHTSIVKMLAQLVSHRVSLDMSPLYAPLKQIDDKKTLIRTVRLGGQDIYAAIVNEANRAKFADAQQMTPIRAKYATQASSPLQNALSIPAPTAMADAVTSAHITFLQSRQAALRQLGEMVTMQMEAAPNIAASVGTRHALSLPPVPSITKAPQLPPAPRVAPSPSLTAGKKPMYDIDKVRAFATGRVADCWGENYAIYDDRRAPRIPNGDLLLITRAVQIKGERYKSEPGTSIHTEYDVPIDAWFYRDNVWPTMPYSVYMEIALQPCGFLSAYHGPTLAFPEIDFYFRNLDGQGRLHKDVDMRGRTITNHVTMLNSTIMQGIIIQKFDFKMYDGDFLFYEGDATFGYFTRESLNSQAGLDQGKQVPRWIDTVTLAPGQVKEVDPHQSFGEGYLKLARGQLEFTNAIRVVPGGGTYGQGYAYANTIIDPNAWFFFCHFFQDPVMPGSIGVETIMQALQAYAIETGLGEGMRSPHFAQVDATSSTDGHNIVWRYRGQILSDSEKSHVEANIKRIEHSPDRIVIYADASLWRDKLRIYEIKDIALAIVEGG